MFDESKSEWLRQKKHPQGLKPDRFRTLLGPAEAVPCYKTLHVRIHQTLPNAGGFSGCTFGTLRPRSGQAFHPTDEDLPAGTPALKPCPCYKAGDADIRTTAVCGEGVRPL